MAPDGQRDRAALRTVRETRDAPRAIEFYKRAFAATELMRFDDDKGTVMHAEILVGDSPIAICVRNSHYSNENSGKRCCATPGLVKQHHCPV